MPYRSVDLFPVRHVAAARATTCALAAAALAISSAGCLDKDDEGGGKGGAGAQLYAIETNDWSSELSYVTTIETLDLQEEVKLDDAVEAAAYSTVREVNDKLFICDGSNVTRYKVDGSGVLADDGAMSLLEQGAVDGSDSAIFSNTKAYAFMDGRAAVWDPSRMKVTGEFEIPPLPVEEGLTFEALGPEYKLARSGNRAYVPTGWGNWADFPADKHVDSYIYVFDTDNDKVIDILSTPCPYLDSSTVDDDGYVYFSAGVWWLDGTTSPDRMKTCIVRIAPGADKIDTDWTFDVADVTDGREGAELHYVGHGKAVFGVYYPEEAQGEDSQPFRLWELDLESKEAKELDQFPRIPGEVATRRVDDRNFVLVPSADWTSTTAYELFDDGSVVRRWNVLGWSRNVFRLR